MADLPPVLDPAEYPPEHVFFDVLSRMHECGLTREEIDPERNVGVVTATPEGYLALGSLLHLILATSGSRDALRRLRTGELAQALTAIGVRDINARPADGQHRG